ncbi:conserved protein, unknown function [Plasmodium gallinaceum]|uniref:Thioredoxin domain-containing protein n=1 Tax=Plasmodium gallinaceum TaxID=5849 RepID=A0A1J1GV36_PLAGA|nr:conserved protein, unknown function [Plasmodium gallinaceum]CRG96102.1 conserved protein, unknown function [Plasmodium gallinaceum]
MKVYFLFFLFLLFCNTFYASILESIKHDLQIVNNQNFNTIVNKFRNEKVFVILFFKKTNKNIKNIIKDYNDVAIKYKGIITFCIADCDTNSSLCENELSLYVPNYKTSDSHYFLVYPVNPMPKFLFNEEVTESNIKKYTYLIPSKIEIIKDEKDLNVFISKHENMPKVLIFSNKKKPNYVLNALSNSFNKKLMFCYINNEMQDLVKKYNIKNFPSIIILKKNKVIDTYKGKHTYINIFDWLNIHSETFVLGGGFDISPDKSDEKPWKFELIPKFTKLSHGDICFKKADKGLCLIYLKEGEKLEKSEIDMLLSLKEKYKPHIDGRGINFRFMWIDIAMETNFRSLFEFNKYPSVVVFNPYKRIRYAKLNEDLIATQENIEKLLEKISGGDAKFTMLKGQVLPEFIQDNENNKTNEKDEL